ILNDGREFPAEIVALDRGIDIAILGVRGVVAPTTLPWGSSQNLPPGISVLVIGSPFGQRNLASTGILAGIAPLSAESDNPEVGQEIGDVLYIDSRTEQGNSGGPVLDLQGRVIGLMDAVLAGASGIGGYGVAIPADLVRQSIQDLERFGVPQRGWLGASLVDLGDLDPLLLRGVGLVSSQGTMLDKIERGSPAANAGLRAAQRDPRGRLVNLGDIILAINGKAVKNKAEVTQTIARFRPSDRVKLIIWREGRKIEVTLTMIARR
ncbi:MAG TPA: trypsin-like peptidase domain-containing protein, partial [Meiothermus sp.]|nr:trypsin-like peptidase domain-containing protein [Meiothermus sp.]